MLTGESSGSPQGISYSLYAAGNFLQRPGFLNVSGEKGNNSAGTCDGDGEPESGQLNRFSFHMEINAKTTQVKPRNTISHRLKAIIVSWGCTTSVAFGLALLAKDESDKIVD
jgi:hypothetical protein